MTPFTWLADQSDPCLNPILTADVTGEPVT